MPKIMQPFVTQLVGDSTDVFAGVDNAEVPSWFRPKYLRLQVIFSDSDELHSYTIGNIRMSINSGPHITGADNVQAPDWQKPHYLIPVPAGLTDFKLVLDHNAVTAGAGMACGQWEG